MSNTSPIILKIKNTAISGNTPSNLEIGELAINRADRKLFYLDAANNVEYFQNSNSFSTVVANGIPLFATSPNDTISVNLDSANAITITANASSQSFSIGLDENNITSFVRKSGDTMTGDLHIESANVYTDALTANTIHFVDANVSGNLYVAETISGPTIQAIDDFANASFLQANSAYDQANTAYGQANTANSYAQQGIAIAQAAYNYANSAVMEVAVTDENVSSTNSSNTFFVTFTDTTNATVNSVFTNVDILTYVPSSGKLSSNTVLANTFSVSDISTISAGTVNLVNLYPEIVDRMDVSSFRSSSYMFQIENGLDSHMINMNVLNGDTLATFSVYGETFTYDSLGSFSANVSSGMVNVLFTPHYAPMTVSFVKKTLMRLGIEYPPVDLGFVYNSTTNILDLGYVFLPSNHIVDYGNLADQLNIAPDFTYAQITGTVIGASVSGNLDTGVF